MAPPPCPYVTSDGKPSYSFEFFPPLTQPGAQNLHDRIYRMSSLSPDGPALVSVTWGAGGSTSDRSLELARFISSDLKNEKGNNVECLLHLTCTNMEKAKVIEALDFAKARGVKNILALRGDPPRDAEYAPTQSLPVSQTNQPFEYALDLITFIRENYGDAFCIGVAGYPETHPDSPSTEDDIAFLKTKVDAGADFILTQLFYDVDVFLQWKTRCREAGITVPIIPGVMAIQNYSSFRRMTTLCKAIVPQSILNDLEPIKHDDIQVKSYGVNLAISMCKRLAVEGHVEGIHLCTLNLEKSARRVLEGLGWIKPGADAKVVNGSGIKWPVPSQENAPLTANIPSITFQQAVTGTEQTTSTAQPQNELLGVIDGAGQIPEGESWDEFPNGRFTDPRSPAYGELDGYGAGLKILPNEALSHWGSPSNTRAISELFTSYLRSEIPSIPWCTSPLESESRAILPLLLRLNSPEKGWWTVGSQPTLDGTPSEDPIYGFGPRGGYIFQKSFVEFFVKESEVREIEEKAKDFKGVVTFYAGNKSGEFRTNMSPEDVNVVTWAIFPGQEIVQSTIIEEVSFLSWKEEAFSIWQDWSCLYPAGSQPRKFLEGIADEYWLVSLVHHDFKDPHGLESFLMG
ncbi:methylenetetrahydrofolate reductase [Phaffia rhodozyma]|uniref:Methylenetetrahydrofolate reductase n=1 Tax=Phaffia rhodozyma TaxID=264483 RepID=A0A0F7SIA3_PHARH|nr:methylenetetrahydrofolate reductase [Phaffia rhodozyma]